MSLGAALGHRVYRSLWLAILLSQTGILIQSVGAAWTVVEAGAPPQQIALVQTAASLPIVLISPLAGALADSFDRRRIMIGAQMLIVTVSLSLAGMTWWGVATPWHVIACIFLIGGGLALNGPAWMASVGDILPRAAVPGAVVSNAIGLNVARSLGPALGGVIVAASGATAAFAISAATSLLLALTLLRWRIERAIADRRDSLPRLGASIVEGVRYSAATPAIRKVLYRAMVFGLACSAVQALLPLIARDLLNGGARDFGLLSGSFGAGALGGAILTSSLRRALTGEAIVRLCTVVAAMAAAGAALSQSIRVTAPCLAAAGAAWVVAFATFNVAIQLASARSLVARTLSLYQMAVFLGVALGSWLGGVAANHVGVRGSLIAASVCAFVSLAAALKAPLEEFSEASDGPGSAQDVPRA